MPAFGPGKTKPLNSPPEIPRAVSRVVVNLPSCKATPVSQREDFVFGQGVLIYVINEFSIVLGWPIDRRATHFQRLDDRRNVG